MERGICERCRLKRHVEQRTWDAPRGPGGAVLCNDCWRYLQGYLAGLHATSAPIPKPRQWRRPLTRHEVAAYLAAPLILFALLIASAVANR